MDGGTVWYFAYGSNMSPAIFLERRRMGPIETRTALLEGYRLCFDIPVGRGERAVANLVAEPAAATHGIAYLLTADDGERLDRSEGVPNLYRREVVELRVGTAEIVAGFTYRSTISVAGRKPSARYLDLLLHGARTHGLPDAYVGFLEAFELAVDERLARTP
jgi:cation transport regulator ChaC